MKKSYKIYYVDSQYNLGSEITCDSIQIDTNVIIFYENTKIKLIIPHSSYIKITKL